MHAWVRARMCAHIGMYECIHVLYEVHAYAFAHAHTHIQVSRLGLSDLMIETHRDILVMSD